MTEYGTQMWDQGNEIFDPRAFILVMFKPLGVTVAEEIAGKLGAEANFVTTLQLIAEPDKLAQHYDSTRTYFTPLSNYMRGKEIWVSILEDRYYRSPAEFIRVMRDMTGKRSPVGSDNGTIRHLAVEHQLPYMRVAPSKPGSNQYCYDNLLHTSDSPESALREIGVWFDDRPEIIERYTQYLNILGNES